MPTELGCAMDTSGQLKDADNIDWYHSESDSRSLPRLAASTLPAVITAEALDSDGKPIPPKQPQAANRAKCSHKPCAKKLKPDTGVESDDKDDDFTMGSSDSESSDSSIEVEAVSNAELASVLLSKTLPMMGRRSGTKKQKRTAPTIIKVEDEDSPHQVSECSLSPDDENTILEEIRPLDQVGSSSGNKTKSKSATKNPIDYFYKSFARGADGGVGNPGDKHFQCCHSNRKIFTLKKTGKSNLTSMVNNLKACSPSMFQLFVALKERPSNQLITEDKIRIASGEKVLDPRKSKEFFKNLKTASENIRAAFEKQAVNAAIRSLGSRKIQAAPC
ncbi:uncharacterized protein LACBIDRAFT_331271 [Laccaria bicolor S238N-H82]|uniref:Predicted protein n=1 Tax=Laccaria bicolor (strain S238N-H82 / ATCC MYA-4686) TaxID=486041 RepID=B0DNZ5_LACBS|nr:uncharacterized protein LACBIDRAFT_331271 [Laccaria bicolor S238N-H82]EDR03817.1 predicted protein [Laccaria bicolor S238N-H82]|eukprot:XP_001885670.1 predicted protein [Laccaria bicolor S238N-H82]